MATNASLTFETAFGDAKHLLDFYDAQRTAVPGDTERVEVLKRAALILAVTAWESYLEDLVQEKFTPRLNEAKTPSDLGRAFAQHTWALSKTW